MILRSCIAFCLSLSFISIDAIGQEYASNKQALYVGIKGAVQVYGIANQNNYGQKEMDYKIPLGLAGGIAVQYKLDERSYLLAEVNYQQQGQSYEDNFNNKSFQKEVRLNYWTVPVLFKYLLSAKSTGYQGVNIAKPKWYASGGLQIGKLSSADIEWKINDALTNFNSFVTDGGNPNQAILEANGTPSDPAEFFENLDVVFVAACGFHSHLNPMAVASVEVRGGFGLTDINAEAWRLNNRLGEYGASRTTFLGIHAGISFRLFEAD